MHIVIIGKYTGGGKATMQMVLLTALGIGGSTIIGAVIGFFVKNVSNKVNDRIMGFAAGVMLAAAINGLIAPAFELVEQIGILIPVIGIFTGAFFLNGMERLIPYLNRWLNIQKEEDKDISNRKLSRALLFVLAVAIHNLPEGMAAGVSFGNEDITAAITVAIGIALQNVPEGIVTISPLVMAGIGARRAFLIAAVTGLIEVIGTLFGFFLASLSKALLPFLLSFAGGTMLYIISDEMIPETHRHGFERSSTYSLLVGFTLMVMMDIIL